VLLDAYILFKSQNPNSVITVFRKNLVTELVQNNAMAVVVRVGRPVKAPQQLERLSGRHFISRIKTNGKNRNLARLCKVCKHRNSQNMEDHPFPPFKRIYDAICVRYHLI
jgi:hypothetical protein